MPIAASLPRRGAVFLLSAGIPATAAEIKSPSADNENDAIADTVKNRNYLEFKSFADQVAQGIYVPPALDKITKSGCIECFQFALTGDEQ